MYRHIALTAFLFIELWACSVNAAFPDIEIGIEYRNDAVDYEEKTSNFIRTKSALALSSKSSLAITAVYADATDEKRWTWNCVLRDISPFLSLVIGYYQVNFGFGLLIGKYSAYNPDVFAYRSPASPKAPFSPVNSGNPAYAFHGLALSLGKKANCLFYSLYIYYSVNRRYLSEDGYFSGMASGSLSTLENTYTSDYFHSEPVTVHNGGLMFSAVYNNMFIIQAYGTVTFLKSQAGDYISWDMQSYPDQNIGISRFSGSGFSICYGDRYLNIFTESVLTIKREINSEGSVTWVYGTGILYGARIRHPLFSLSVVRKKTQAPYYAPYNSTIGERYPEKGIFLDGYYRISKSITLGGSIATEKIIAPSSRDRDLSPVIRRQAYLEYDSPAALCARIRYKFLNRSYYGSIQKSRQVHSSAKLKACEEKLEMSAALIFQEKTAAGNSYLMGTGLALKPINRIKLHLYHAYCIVAEGNILYATLLPLERSSIPGMFIRRTSHVLAGKLSFNYRSFRFSCRYLQQLVKDQSYHKRMELAGRGVF